VARLTRVTCDLSFFTFRARVEEKSHARWFLFSVSFAQQLSCLILFCRFRVFQETAD
jgi:hypothetical protein